MKQFIRSCARSPWLRSPLVTLGFTLLLAAPAFAQGTSPRENAANVLETAFTSTIARGLRSLPSWSPDSPSPLAKEAPSVCLPAFFSESVWPSPR